MKIPVFHDDQHGTAIVVAAAILNGLHLVGKDLQRSSWLPPAPARRRWPVSTCWSCWAPPVREHLGHRHQGRRPTRGRVEEMDEIKARYASVTDARTLGASSRAPTCSSASRPAAS